MKKGFLIASTLILLGYVCWHFKRQYDLLKQTCISFNGFKINEININRIAIDLFFKIKNYSSVAIKLEGYNFKVYINNILVSTIVEKKTQLLERDGVSDLELNVIIDTKKITNADIISSLLLNYSNAMVRIVGEITAEVGGVAANKIPVNIESKLKDMMPGGTNTKSKCV